jgi:hypothetical protein
MAIGSRYNPTNYIGMASQADQSGLNSAKGAADLFQRGFDMSVKMDERDRLTSARQEFDAAWMSNDPNAVQRVIAKFPEYAAKIQQSLGVRDDQHRQQVGSMAIQLSGLLESGNVAGAQEYVKQNSHLFDKSGPFSAEGVVNELGAAAADPKRLDAWKSWAQKLSLSTLAPKEIMDYGISQQQLAQQLSLGQQQIALGYSNQASRNANTANLNNYRRDMLDFQKMKFDQAGGLDVMADINGNPLSSYKYNTQMLQTGVNPRTGKTATGAQLKAAKDWKAGDAAFTTAQMGLHRGLKQIQEIIPMLSEGVGPYTGRLPEMLLGDKGVRVRNLVASMQSGQFLANVKNLQGMGALSNAEGERVLNLIAKLDVTQGDKVVLQSLKDIETQYSKLIAANAQDAAAMGYSLEQLNAYLEDEDVREANAQPSANNAPPTKNNDHSNLWD